MENKVTNFFKIQSNHGVLTFDNVFAQSCLHHFLELAARNCRERVVTTSYVFTSNEDVWYSALASHVEEGLLDVVPLLQVIQFD